MIDSQAHGAASPPRQKSTVWFSAMTNAVIGAGGGAMGDLWGSRDMQEPCGRVPGAIDVVGLCQFFFCTWETVSWAFCESQS